MTGLTQFTRGDLRRCLNGVRHFGDQRLEEVHKDAQIPEADIEVIQVMVDALVSACHKAVADNAKLETPKSWAEAVVDSVAFSATALQQRLGQLELLGTCQVLHLLFNQDYQAPS